MKKGYYAVLNPHEMTENKKRGRSQSRPW